MRKALILGILAGVITVTLLIRFFPSNDDFNLDNPFWNGLKDFKKETMVFSTSFTSTANFIPFPSKTILFIIGPSGTYNREEINSISGYVRSGGTLVLADDFGSGNSVLEGLGLKTRFSQHLVVDPLFRGKSSLLPKTVNLTGFLAEIKSLMFNYPTSLKFNESEGKILATSSSFSFFDDNLNGKKDENENQGPFPVIAEISYGAGKIYIVSDSSIFINSMLKEESNQKFLKIITKGKKVLIDISHHPAGILPKLKDKEIKIYQIASRFEVKYPLFLILMLAILWLKFKRKKSLPKENIQNILQRHPSWNKDVLNKLKRSLKNDRRDKTQTS